MRLNGFAASSASRTICSDFDECASAPCVNGACSESRTNRAVPPGRFTCACDAPWAGPRCERCADNAEWQSASFGKCSAFKQGGALHKACTMAPETQEAAGAIGAVRIDGELRNVIVSGACPRSCNLCSATRCRPLTLTAAHNTSACRNVHVGKSCAVSCARGASGFTASFHCKKKIACDPKKSKGCASCVATVSGHVHGDKTTRTWADAVARCRVMGLDCSCVPCERSLGCSSVAIPIGTPPLCNVTNHCATNPCAHGECKNVAAGDTFQCKCAHGFKGKHCNICKDDPRWSSQYTRRKCSAYKTIMHKLCNNSIFGAGRSAGQRTFANQSCPIACNTGCGRISVLEHECKSAPCKHGGTCLDTAADRRVRLGSYRCRCTSLWGGTNCETRMCKDDLAWRSTHGDKCANYRKGQYHTFYSYCNKDKSQSGVLAQTACPHACDVCGGAWPMFHS